MTRFSQYDYKSGPASGPAGFLGRVLAFIVGLGVLIVSVFVGAVFMAAIVGIVLIIAAVFAVRIWWIRRKMERYQREHGDLSAEYTVVEERHKEIDRF